MTLDVLMQDGRNRPRSLRPFIRARDTTGRIRIITRITQTRILIRLPASNGLTT